MLQLSIMQQPLISILIPFKNTEAFLQNVLDSIIEAILL